MRQANAAGCKGEHLVFRPDFTVKVQAEQRATGDCGLPQLRFSFGRRVSLRENLANTHLQSFKG